MKVKEKLKKMLEDIVSKTLPFLKDLFEEKIIPTAIKKGYEVFDKFADEKIEALAEQVEKYETALDPEKKEKYKKGILLGSKILEAVAEKLQAAALEFKKAVN